MSASLVGSEMCIRDRPDCTSGKRNFAPSQRGAPTRSPRSSAFARATLTSATTFSATAFLLPNEWPCKAHTNTSSLSPVPSSSQQRAPRYRFVAWRFPCAPMNSARREEIFGVLSWFDRLLSVHHIHSGRQMFPCSVHALALQRVDLLRTLSTESPASHYSGLSCEIALFRISHLCVNLAFVVGHCALQLRAAGKHAVRSRAVPIRIAIDGRQRRATGEHQSMSVTFWVLKCDKSRDFKPEQPENISLMSVTFCVLKFFTSREV